MLCFDSLNLANITRLLSKIAKINVQQKFGSRYFIALIVVDFVGRWVHLATTYLPICNYNSYTVDSPHMLFS